MKQHITILLALLLLATGLTGCSKEETPSGTFNSELTQMTISVTDGGYDLGNASGNAAQQNANNGPQTRATDNEYTTTFAANDKIGLYVVKADGTIISNNVPLTHNGTGWTGDAYYGGKDAKYFAYYPYQQSISDSPEPSSSTAADFFAKMVLAWKPSTDQSTHALYTANDLIIGSGVVGNKQANGTYPLAFAMNHAMSLVVIEVPATEYTLTDKNGESLSHYKVSAYDTKFYDFTPYSTSVGTYRYIVKPGVRTNQLYGSFSNANGAIKEYRIHIDYLEPAEYVCNKVDGGIIHKTHQLQVGDFYMNDGSLLANLTLEQKFSCIGIVFWVGDATQKDVTLKNDHPGCTHGLVVGLNEDPTIWQSNLVSVQNWLDTNMSGKFLSVQTGVGPDDPLNNIQGYNNTKAIEEFNKNNPNSIVTAVNKVIAYRQTFPTSKISSNWYLPSEKELTLLCGRDLPDIWTNYSGGIANRDIINSKLLLAGGTKLSSSLYWSSSESSAQSEFTISFSNGTLERKNKNVSGDKVRFLLAF